MRLEVMKVKMMNLETFRIRMEQIQGKRQTCILGDI